ncbi:MAG: type IV toxin-antitoxin system AbiEi family antitoxin domain-containing protein [Actinomycetota bacterium]
MQRDAEYLRLAAQQLGLITRRQLLMLGLTERMIDIRIARGALVVVHPGVYRVAGVPVTWEQRLLAACFWAGRDGAASFRAAGKLWEFDAVPVGFVEISATRKLDDRRVHVHRLNLAAHEVTRRRGIPVTDPTRTLLDLGAVLPINDLEAALESALRKKLTRLPLLLERFDSWTRPGRRGAGKWRRLLEIRDPGQPPTASYLETLMSQLAREYDLGELQRQYVVRDATGRFVARLDFALPEIRFGIETNGGDPHLGRKPWEGDQQRGNNFILVDWDVLNFPWSRITKDRAGVAREVQETVRMLTHLRGGHRGSNAG